MKQFRLNRPPGKQKTELPHIRVSQPYYQLVYRLRQETGLPMGNIIEQCISYALRSGGDWERSMLDLYVRPGVPTGCPLLEQEELPEDEDEDEGGGTACRERT